MVSSAKSHYMLFTKGWILDDVEIKIENDTISRV